MQLVIIGIIRLNFFKNNTNYNATVNDAISRATIANFFAEKKNQNDN